MANFELQEIEDIKKPEELTLSFLSNLITSYRLDHLNQLINDKDLICSPTEGNFETICGASRFVYGAGNIRSERDSEIGIKKIQSDSSSESIKSKGESVIETNTAQYRNIKVENLIFCMLTYRVTSWKRQLEVLQITF